MTSVGQRRRDNPVWHLSYAVSTLSDDQLLRAHHEINHAIHARAWFGDSWLMETLMYVNAERRVRNI